MRIFVSGADGFIGSHLVEALRDRGDDVTGLALYNSLNPFGWMDEIDGIRKVRGDIRDAEQMRALIAGNDLVFHLAALISVPHSYDAPRSYIDTNVTGTLNVLMAARDAGAKVVHTSTSEVYGTARYTPMDELHPINPQSPYAASKVAADALVNACRLSYGMQIVVARPFNTWGHRQSARAVIASVCQQIAAGGTVSLGNRGAIRDFVHVSDTVRGLLAVSGLSTGVWNIATGVGRSISELVEGYATRSDGARLRPPESEVETLVGDSAALTAKTGWRPMADFDDSFAATIEWWRTRTRGRKTIEYIT